MMILLHNKVEVAHSLGPGRRAGLWVQGCSMNCPGCFNPGTHDRRGREVDVDEVTGWLTRVSAEHRIEGLTVSGGEPMEQPEAVLELCYHAKVTGLTTIAYSGWAFEPIYRHPIGYRLLGTLDVLICGPFKEDLKCGGMRGSANKSVVRLTNKYAQKDLEVVPEAELIIQPDGSGVWLGTCVPEVPQ